MKVLRKALNNMSFHKPNLVSPASRNEGFSFHEGISNAGSVLDRKINNYTKGNNTVMLINNKQQRRMLGLEKRNIASIDKSKRRQVKQASVIDQKVATPEKKIGVLKEYLKSIGNSFHQNHANKSFSPLNS